MRELVDAHALLLGVIGSMLEEHNGKPVPVADESVARKFVLTAAFIQGITLCEKSILDGLYLQAGSLIRQEYETLILLNEIKAGTRRDGKVGNAKHAFWKGNKHYGELSALAHLSNHQILESIIGYNTTWGDFASTTPSYQRENALRLYGFHTSMLLGLVEELKDLYTKMYNFTLSDRESKILDIVASVLIQAKVFKTPKEGPSSS